MATTIANQRAIRKHLFGSYKDSTSSFASDEIETAEVKALVAQVEAAIKSVVKSEPKSDLK